MNKDFTFNLTFPEPTLEYFSDYDTDDEAFVGPVTSENITYSDMYTCAVPFVPESFRHFMIEKGEKYAANNHGYPNKDYTSSFAAQIEINSNADEASCFELLKDSTFCKEVEHCIANASFKIQAFNSYEKRVCILSKLDGVYSYNTNHGEINHDIPGHLTENQNSSQDKPKTYIDILRDSAKSKYNSSAIWSIEIKSSTENSLPKDMHHADLVFLHKLGTSTLFIYASPELRPNRADHTYRHIGTISGYGTWNNIKVENDWSIKKWT